jgi:hypothetical protein
MPSRSKSATNSPVMRSGRELTAPSLLAVAADPTP